MVTNIETGTSILMIKQFFWWNQKLSCKNALFCKTNFLICMYNYNKFLTCELFLVVLLQQATVTDGWSPLVNSKDPKEFKTFCCKWLRFKYCSKIVNLLETKKYYYQTPRKSIYLFSYLFSRKCLTSSKS